MNSGGYQASMTKSVRLEKNYLTSTMADKINGYSFTFLCVSKVKQLWIIARNYYKHEMKCDI